MGGRTCGTKGGKCMKKPIGTGCDECEEWTEEKGCEQCFWAYLKLTSKDTNCINEIY